MQKTSVAEVVEFVRVQTGHRGTIDEQTTLLGDIGVDGDDMEEFLTAYGDRFDVDLSTYLWYFHAGEEGINIGALFCRPPYARVSRIPITVGMLHQFAGEGRWNIDYPDLQLPFRRVDILITQGCAVGLMIAMLALAVLIVFG